MKINVTVDLSEFYSEEDGNSFTNEIKGYISGRVKNEVWEKFKENAFESFSNQVGERIRLDKDLKIGEAIDDVFYNKKIKKRYGSSEPCSVSEFVEDYFQHQVVNSNDFTSKVDKIIKAQAEDIVKELKARYDLLFASQIVLKLNENGMLKEDVAKLLLNDKN